MDPQQQRPLSRRLTSLAAGVVASVVLAAGPGYALGTGPRAGDPTPAPAPAAPAAPAASPAPAPAASAASAVPAVPSLLVTPGLPAAPAAPGAAVVPGVPSVPSPPFVATVPVTRRKEPAGAHPAFGAYLDHGPRGVARIAQLSNWLGGADLRVAHTYLPGDRWSNIEGLSGFLDAWANWRKLRADRILVLNVPMMERNEEGVPDAEVRALLRRGAAGEFDHHYRTLARRLVALGVPDTVVVLGWEMNGITYTHRCGPDPESWKKYWKRIVTAMRAVPGQKFTFDWTPNRGRDAVPWTQCYPGDDTVDVIGMDSYDQPRGVSFDQQVSEPYGLQAHVDFAKARGKPFSYAEWGLFRNGDNAAYMRRMLAWMDRHRPLYNTITDYCPHGVWQCAANPAATAVYRSVLSGRGGPSSAPSAPAPAPVPPGPAPATTTAPVRPDLCSPLDLGEWAEYWLGGKFCLSLGPFSRDR